VDDRRPVQFEAGRQFAAVVTRDVPSLAVDEDRPIVWMGVDRRRPDLVNRELLLTCKPCDAALETPDRSVVQRETAERLVALGELRVHLFEYVVRFIRGPDRGPEVPGLSLVPAVEIVLEDDVLLGKATIAQDRTTLVGERFERLLRSPRLEGRE